MTIISFTATQHIKRYLVKFLPKELRGWKQIIQFYGLIGLLCLVGVIALTVYISPLPPGTVYLATGQEGTSYKGISEAFQKSFKEKGIRLELVTTSGLGEGLKNLDSVDSKVSASFLTAGVASASEYPGLVSLGNIQYAPIWIFYRGELIETNDPFEYFSTKKIAIGPPENVTNKIFRRLFQLNQNKSPLGDNFLELSYKDAVNEFIEGKLDAVFVIDSYRAEVVQKILSVPNVKIMNFPLADAYMKQMPFLQKLVIPKGSINLESVYPSEDITILASTTTLLVEKSMHSAAQWAYLTSAQEVASDTSTFFEKPGFFPKYLDQSFPLSPVAKRFYKEGTPAVFSYLPFWLASLTEEIWTYLLAFIILIYPTYKLLYSIRIYPAEFLMNTMFVNLRELDEAINQAQSSDEIKKIIASLQIYEKQIYENWIFKKNARFYFNLKNALTSLKRDAEAKLGKISI